jgi:hypothetical protein
MKWLTHYSVYSIVQEQDGHIVGKDSETQRHRRWHASQWNNCPGLILVLRHSVTWQHFGLR